MYRTGVLIYVSTQFRITAGAHKIHSKINGEEIKTFDFSKFTVLVEPLLCFTARLVHRSSLFPQNCF